MYIFPADYYKWIKRDCRHWLNHGNVLKTPLRHLGLTNLSRLASLTNKTTANDNSPHRSMRISTHRQNARRYLVEDLGIDLADNAKSSRIYALANSTKARTLDARLSNIGVPPSSFHIFFRNAEGIPSWVPSYARTTFTYLTHNALFTSRRLHGNESCYLCGDGKDDIQHIFSDCRIARRAHDCFWAPLDRSPTFSISNAINAVSYQDSATNGAQLILTDSIWRA
jgi:hypothetical protein